MDAEIASVTLIGGRCNAGAALLECRKSLFVGDAGGRARILLVLMAGQSADDVSRGAGLLKQAGVKIIAIGMDGSFVQAQLSAMAFSSGYILTAASFSGLAGVRGSAARLIYQGC